MLVKSSQVWSEPRAVSVLSSTFLNGACLFKMVRKALLKNNQASSTDGMRSISFQDTWARLIRKACWQKCFREAFDSDEGWSFDRGPIADTGNGGSER